MEDQYLDRELHRARLHLESVTRDYWSVPRDAPERIARHQAVKDALGAIDSLHRRLAEITGDEYVVAVDLGFFPEAAVSGASLVQGEGRDTALTFSANRALDDGSCESCGTAIVRFGQTLVTQFGLPNDEAQKGHALYDRGFEYFSDPGEVLNSSWLRLIEERNKIAFPATSDWMRQYRHFIFQFHDASFECIAESISGELVDS